LLQLCKNKTRLNLKLLALAKKTYGMLVKAEDKYKKAQVKFIQLWNAHERKKLYDYCIRTYCRLRNKFLDKNDKFIAIMKQYAIRILGYTKINLNKKGKFEEYYNPLGLADLPPGGPVADRKPKKERKGPK